MYLLASQAHAPPRTAPQERGKDNSNAEVRDWVLPKQCLHYGFLACNRGRSVFLISSCTSTVPKWPTLSNLLHLIFENEHLYLIFKLPASNLSNPITLSAPRFQKKTLSHLEIVHFRIWHTIPQFRYKKLFWNKVVCKVQSWEVLHTHQKTTFQCWNHWKPVKVLFLHMFWSQLDYKCSFVLEETCQICFSSTDWSEPPCIYRAVTIPRSI